MGFKMSFGLVMVMVMKYGMDSTIQWDSWTQGSWPMQYGDMGARETGTPLHCGLISRYHRAQLGPITCWGEKILMGDQEILSYITSCGLCNQNKINQIL
jgi:hypothetical protein